MNWQIKQIKEDFNKLYKKDLIKWVESETSGAFKKLLISLLQGNRSENQTPDPSMMSNDAQALYKAGAGRWGTEFQGNIICIDPKDSSLWNGGQAPKKRQKYYMGLLYIIQLYIYMQRSYQTIWQENFPYF